MKKIILFIILLVSLSINGTAQIKNVSKIYKGPVKAETYLGAYSSCYLDFDPNDSTYTIIRKSMNRYDDLYRFPLGKLDDAKKTVGFLLDLLNHMNVNDYCTLQFFHDNEETYLFTKGAKTFLKQTYYGFYVSGIENYADITYLNEDELELYLIKLKEISDEHYLYLHNYKEYRLLKSFLKHKKFETPRGTKVKPIKFLSKLKKKDFIFSQQHKILDTPIYVDNWLYYNCNFSFIQDWLKSKYTDNKFKELVSPEYEHCTDVNIKKEGYNKCLNKKWLVTVTMNNPESPECKNFLLYNKKSKFWILPDENDVYTDSGSSPYIFTSIKDVMKTASGKWNLPKGCKIKLTGKYNCDDWLLETI